MKFSLDPYNLDNFPENSFIRTGFQPPMKRENLTPSGIMFTTDREKQVYEQTKNFLSNTHWKYSDPNKVTYEFNTDGFRESIEFDDVDWENTSVLVGCSYVMGHCCEEENTITSILTRDYGVPFINGGQPGAGNRTIHNNAITFMKKYRPKKVIILWSYHGRYAWLNIDRDVYGTQYWHATHHTPQDDKQTQRRMQANYNVPRAFYDPVNYDEIHQWKTSSDIHDLLGNKQYHISHKYPQAKSFNDDSLWIKPSDDTLYKKLFINNGRFGSPRISLDELQKPEIYELINKMCARDISWDPKTEILQLGHYGEQMNRDIADLIYRENFR